MKKLSILLFIVVVFGVFAANSNAQTQAEQLKQMTAQLQASPNDNALRERIIKFAPTMKPAPAISEEANKAYVKGGVFKENAKDASDYDLAVAAFREAVRIAPWWGDAYFNLGVTLGLAGKFDEAIASLKLSMSSVPADSKEARDAQNRIYALEAKAELASKQAATANAETERAARAATAKAKTLIVPGVGVGEVKLGMSESQVIALWGTPSSRDEFGRGAPYSGVNLLWKEEPEGNLFIEFVVSEGLRWVNVHSRGYATVNGLSIGSSKSDVIAAMGNPGRTKDQGIAIQNAFLMCYEQGIVFAIKPPSTTVTHIIVVNSNRAFYDCGGR